MVSQIVASIAVVASLLFVGRQLKENTMALQRHEHNSTMEQWTVVRMALAKNPDIAELMTAGIEGERPLTRAEQLRLEQMLQEITWAAFHIWDRTQRGVFPKARSSSPEGRCCAASSIPRAAARGGAARKGSAFIQRSSPMSTCSSPPVSFHRSFTGRRLRFPLFRLRNPARVHSSRQPSNEASQLVIVVNGELLISPRSH